MTNLTYGILPCFFWSLFMPIMYLVSGGNMAACRISQGVVTHTCFPDRSESSPTLSHSRRITEQKRWYVIKITCS